MNTTNKTQVAPFAEMVTFLRPCIFLICFFTMLISCNEEESKVTPASKGYTILKSFSGIGANSVYAVPKATLNHALDKELDIDGQTFRPVLREFVLANGINNVPGEIAKSNDGAVVAIYPEELLPENAALTATIVLSWEIKRGAAWEAADDKTETKTYSFSSGLYASPSSIVSSIKPDTESTDQSLFVNPFVRFSQKITEPIAVDITRLRAITDDAGLRQNGSEVAKQLVTSKTNDTLTIIPDVVLQPLTEYEVYYKFHWEREVNGVWKPCKQNGEIRYETVSSVFTTKDEAGSLTTLLPENIRYAYPIPFQYHFLKSEYPSGFVTLNSAKQNYLFDDAYVFTARFSSPGQANINVALSLDANTNRLTHAIPTGLMNEKIYKLQYLRKPVGSNAEEELYVTWFRTSKFNAFAEKIADITTSNPIRETVGLNVFYLRSTLPALEEYFDDFELEQKTVTTPQGFEIKVNVNLIQFEAVLENNPWYVNHVHPLLYAPWTDPLFKPAITRDTSIVGFLPVNAMGFKNFTAAGRLTPEQISSNSAAPIATSHALMIHYSPAPFIHADYMDFREAALSKYLGAESVPARESALITGETPYLRNGVYSYRIKYVLPNGTVTSTSNLLTIENLVPDPE